MVVNGSNHASRHCHETTFPASVPLQFFFCNWGLLRKRKLAVDGSTLPPLSGSQDPSTASPWASNRSRICKHMPLPQEGTQGTCGCSAFE